MNTETYTDGGLHGVIYRMQKNDTLPMHVHTEIDVHVTFVIAGEIEAFGPDRIWTEKHGPGSFLSFHTGDPHQIEALQDGTVILSLLKGIVATHDTSGSKGFDK